MSATIDTKMFADYFKQGEAELPAMKLGMIDVPGRTFFVRAQYLEDILATMTESYDHDLLQRTLIDEGRALNSAMFLFEEFKMSKELDKYRTLFLGTDFDKPETSSIADEDPATLPDEEIASDEEQLLLEKKDIILHYGHNLSKKRERKPPIVRQAGLNPIELICAIVAHIVRTTERGDSLVFLPGFKQIQHVADVLAQSKPLGVDFEDKEKIGILKLHSLLEETNDQAFQPVRGGCRRIILATNIAETSITLSDVQYVVDSGKAKEKSYDAVSRKTIFRQEWISKDNCTQRRGRAGRVQDGHYYAVFSKERVQTFSQSTVPEMRRSDLTKLCLEVAGLNFRIPIAAFLASAIEPPDPRGVEVAVSEVKRVGALLDSEEITPLGRALVQLPVHPSLGSMILFGILFRCLEPMLILGSVSWDHPLVKNRA